MDVKMNRNEVNPTSGRTLGISVVVDHVVDGISGSCGR